MKASLGTAKLISCHPERSAAQRREVEGPAVVHRHAARTFVVLK
jgi:hypothetical protein